MPNLSQYVLLHLSVWYRRQDATLCLQPHIIHSAVTCIYSENERVFFLQNLHLFQDSFAYEFMVGRKEDYSILTVLPAALLHQNIWYWRRAATLRLHSAVTCIYSKNESFLKNLHFLGCGIPNLS